MTEETAGPDPSLEALAPFMAEMFAELDLAPLTFPPPPTAHADAGWTDETEDTDVRRIQEHAARLLADLAAAGEAEEPPAIFAGERAAATEASTAIRAVLRCEEYVAGADALARRLRDGAAATTGPATTGPVTTGPVTTDPATTGPVTTGPVTTDPATTDPATTDPATTVRADTLAQWRADRAAELAEREQRLAQLEGGEVAPGTWLHPSDEHLSPTQRHAVAQATRMEILTLQQALSSAGLIHGLDELSGKLQDLAATFLGQFATWQERATAARRRAAQRRRTILAASAGVFALMVVFVDRAIGPYWEAVLASALVGLAYWLIDAWRTPIMERANWHASIDLLRKTVEQARDFRVQLRKQQNGFNGLRTARGEAPVDLVNLV